MPGENAKIVRGPVTSIQVIAPIDMAAGDFYTVAQTDELGQEGCVGFFPDAVKQGETGTFIIGAQRIEIDRDSGDNAAHPAGQLVIYRSSPGQVNRTNRSMDIFVFGQNPTQRQFHAVGRIAKDTPADSTTIQFVFYTPSI